MGGSSGSSKKQTIGYKYHIGAHLVLCHGPVDYLLEIKVDGRVAWSGRVASGTIHIDKPGLFGGESREGGVSGYMDFESGSATQGVNAYLDRKLGSLVPAFRGVAAAVLKQMYIGLNPYLKKWAFRMKRIHTRQNGLPQWYDTTAEINGDSFSLSSSFSSHLSGATLRGVAYSDGVWIIAGDSSSKIRSEDGGSSWMTESMTPGWFVDAMAGDGEGSWVAAAQGYDDIWVSGNDGETFSLVSLPVFGAGITTMRAVAHGNGIWMIGGAYGGSGVVSVSANGVSWTSIPSGYMTGDSTVETLAHMGGSNWIHTNLDGRVRKSPDDGLNWYPVTGLSPDTATIVRVNSLGTFVVFRNIDGAPEGGRVARSTDYGVTWTQSTFSGFSASDIGMIGGLLILVGNSGKVAVSYNLGVTWENVSGTFLGGSRINSIFCSDSLGWMCGDDGKISKIEYVFSRKGDMNPAHIIRECLTDPDWGMGYLESDIDEPSFKAAADTLFQESFGLSLLWDRQSPIDEFIGEVLRHIDASLYVDRKTGLYVLKLIRGDYDTETLLHLNESNIEKIENFSRPVLGELPNSISVKYWDTDTGTTASLTLQDIALIQLQQATINTTLQYPGITNANLAARVAQSNLKSLTTPRISCTVYSTRVAKDLNIGGVFLLTWPDYEVHDVVMRITEVSYGDGKSTKVKISCTQDTFALPDTSYLTAPPSAWVDPNTPPVPVVDRLVFEVPYLELVQQQGQTAVDGLLSADPEIGYVGAAALRPQTNAINARLRVDDGAGFEDVGGMDFCPGASVGEEIGILNSTFSILEAEDLGEVALGSWCQVGQEMMQVTALSDASISVLRGILDTVPTPHVTGEAIFFWDAYAQGSPTEYVSGDMLDVRILTSTGGGELSMDDAPEDSLSIVGRAARPYRPGNLKVGEYYDPENYELEYPLLLTYTSRNRLQETAGTLLSWFDDSITSEPGVTYDIRVAALDEFKAEVETIHTESTASLTYLLLEETVSGSDYPDAPFIKVGIKSIRDGLSSWAESQIVMQGIPDYVPPDYSWYPKDIGFGTTTIRSMASNGSGTLVAVGDSGKISSSLDGGETWTVRTSNLYTEQINDVDYGAGQFIAISSSYTATSPDGITWTRRETGGGYGIHYSTAASIWVKVGTSRMIRTAPDGVTWTARSTGSTSGAFRSVSSGPSYIVAVGDGQGYGDVAWCATGTPTTWNAQVISGSSNKPRKVDYMSTLGKFVLSGAGGYVAKTNTGVPNSWIAVTDALLTGDLWSVVDLPTELSIMGASNKSVLSDDLTSWASDDPGFGASIIYGGVFDGTKLWACGASGKVAKRNVAL